MTAAETLRAGAGDAWDQLGAHPFVTEMADGTLPPDRFRFYIEQNLLYLPEFARCLALGAARASDLADAATFARAVTEVIEVEIPANRDLLARVAELCPVSPEPPVMAPGTLAYTAFLVRLAYESGPLGVMAAILPCAWSYREIARSLPRVAPHPVYREWIAFFTGEVYNATVDELLAQFETMAAGADLAALQATFTTSVRLERGFWDMAYDLVTWPDLAPVAA